jgi:hypothetical protein
VGLTLCPVCLDKERNVPSGTVGAILAKHPGESTNEVQSMYPVLNHQSCSEILPSKELPAAAQREGSKWRGRIPRAGLLILSFAFTLSACSPLPEEVDSRDDTPPLDIITHVEGTDDEGGCAVVPIADEEEAIIEKSGVHAVDGPPMVVFLNRNGGTYQPGQNNSATNRSSIVRSNSRVPAFERGDGSWRSLVSCVAENYSRFNLHVTDVEPEGGRYIEVVIGGHPGNIGVGNGVGGIAPINMSSCRPIETAIAFVFSRNLGDQAHLCKVTTHEIGHTISLEHEYLCEDPMTYLRGCGVKTFQDQSASCGTYSARRCQCRGGRQNTVETLYDLVGAQNGLVPPSPEDDEGPPSIALAEPEDGTTFRENATIDIRAEITDDVRVGRVELIWDYNGKRYECPRSGQYVDCSREGDIYHWTVKVSSGQRSFRIRALDSFGKESETVSRTVFLTPDGVVPPPVPDNELPAINLVGPQGNTQFNPDSDVIVEAQITDDGELHTAHLLWGYNGEEYPCPTDGRSVTCTVDGDRYRWVVQVGTIGPRSFNIRARDTAGGETVSQMTTVQVAEPNGAPVPPRPEPAPEPDPEPAPEPDPEPAPEPDPQPAPEPDPQPAPEPDPQPAPEPDPQPAPEPDPESPAPPNDPNGPERPEEPIDPNTGRPVIEVISPAAGSRFETDSTIDILASIVDADEVTSAELVWEYNGERYACPTQGPNVNCEVEGDLYRWTVRVGSANERPFQISARNARGRRTTSLRRMLYVGADNGDNERRINVLEPAENVRWRANSQVRVVARLPNGLSSARLLWSHNGNEYECPRNGRYVDCSRSGDTYTWLITVGQGSRTFQVRAGDGEGNQVLTPSRTIRLEN